MRIRLFSIGNFPVNGYGAMIGLGILLCTAMACYRAKKKGLEQEVVMDIILISALAGFGGAKLLYMLIEFRQLIKDPLSVIGSSGFVVYGGIITGILCVMLYCKKKNLHFAEYFDLIMPSAALAQGFGRIGCFLAGCCYGIRTRSPIGVTFPTSGLAPAGVSLLPAQLFFAAADFLHVLILLWLSKRAKHTGDVGIAYLLFYGIGRFALEFMRSDRRGFVFGFSTSQVISIGIVLIALILTLIRKRE